MLYHCYICPHTTTTSKTFTHHMRGHANGRDCFKCRHCELRFHCLGSWSKHMGSHVDAKNFQCDICGMKLKSRSTKQQHLKTHQSLNFVCSLCGQEFKTRKSLIFHELRHNDIRLHVCDECGKSFTHPHLLKRHQSYHNKQFKCQTCGKKFGLRHNLKVHEYTHTGEKPHCCQHCGKGFAQTTSLQHHYKNCK
ncbi:unnamed protein product [Owenia fusiformis]|uniref:Uncharacterized protein n=1 Tax=Owenia fusiformis TaxID=6347 RepID=A0A8S4PDT1_OWEFU|nr:unnamed protein product [Owenia fusiformis]